MLITLNWSLNTLKQSFPVARMFPLAVMHVFTHKPLILFQSARKLSSYLVRAKLYPAERTVGPISVAENAARSA